MPRKARVPAAAASKEKEFYSTLEAADILQVSFQTVARWMDRGHLTGWRTPGGHRLISAASLDLVRKDRAGLRDQTPPASPGPRILIVDDSADDLELLRATIASGIAGAQVTAADNAIAALLSMGQFPPDVLITDIMMPDVDGLEMIRRLREAPQTSAIKVIVVSNYRERAITQRFGPLPKDVSFLGKPVAIDALQKLLGVSAGQAQA
jgi:excisionase family DNA binding protein